jgi:putative DNA primase/helicase
MQSAPRWVVWRYGPLRNGKPTKPPYYLDGTLRSGTLDTPADIAKLGTFEDALAVLQSRRWAGVGFVLGADDTGSSWQGIDLDHTDTRPELAALVDLLPGYVERSPSGTGVHAIGYGRPFKTLGPNRSGIEAYSAARYFTVTGDAIQGDIADVSGFVVETLAPLHGGGTTHTDATGGTPTLLVPSDTQKDLRSALASLRSDDRDRWIKIGHALKALGDVGRGLWFEWSQTSEKYNAEDAARVWESFKPSSIDYRTVFAEAQRAGWVNPKQAVSQERTAPPAAGVGVAPVADMAKARAAKAKAKPKPAPVEVEQDPLPFVRNSRNRVLRTIENTRVLLDHYQVRVSFDIVQKDMRIEIPGLRCTKENEGEATIAHVESLCGRHGVPSGALPQFLLAIADQNAINPPLDWIRSRAWDQQDRFPALCGTLDTDRPELRDKLLPRWLVAAAGCVVEPDGFVPHGVLVLQGAQGKVKTSWFRRLAPIADWIMTEALLDLKDKDKVKDVVSHWITELAELDVTFRHSDVIALKAFLTNTKDVIRLPYARSPSNFPRRTAFCGSVNDVGFLRDRTGNRRFWTVPVRHIDYQHTVDMQQVWAQAVAMYEAGSPTYLSPDEMAWLEEQNAAFTQADPIMERLAEALDWEASPTLWTPRTASGMCDLLGFKTDQGMATKMGTTLSRYQHGGAALTKTTRGGVSRYLTPPRRLPLPDPPCFGDERF